MALVIEDGTIVAGAVSFITAVEARAYANERGLSIPADDAALEKLIIQAADYLDTLDFKGTRTDSAVQPLSWPRSGVYLFSDDEPLADDAIPSLLKKGQCQLTVDAHKRNGDLMPTGDGREVKKTKVDVLEKEYFEKGSGSVLPEYNKALSILAPLMNTGAGFVIETFRA